MKYIREYKEIDFDDFDDEEEEHYKPIYDNDIYVGNEIFSKDDFYMMDKYAYPEPFLIKDRGYEIEKTTYKSISICSEIDKNHSFSYSILNDFFYLR